MKIAIITCHTPLNYGAQLQAYALQTHLELEGNEVQIIDYSPDYYLEEQSFLYVGDKRWSKNWVLKIAYILMKFPSRYIRKKHFANFQKDYLHLSKHRYRCYEELIGLTPIADKYICGSDQIWNTKGIRGFSPAFYLDFVENNQNRASYAACMSIDFPITERVKRDVIPLINKLSYISVREKVIADELQPFVNKHIYHVLDPVFLLDKEQWAKICDKSFETSKPYILIYPMGVPNNVIKNAKILSQKTGLPIYCITASRKRFSGIAKSYNCSIPTFVNLFKNASYIITNSFHGTSFSIIFRKVFWTCEIGNNNHRLTSLLDIFHLKNRYISDGEVINPSMHRINYNELESNIESVIKNSKLFLAQYINEE